MGRRLGLGSFPIELGIELPGAGQEPFVSISVHITSNLFINILHIAIHRIRGEEISILGAPLQLLVGSSLSSGWDYFFGKSDFIVNCEYLKRVLFLSALRALDQKAPIMLPLVC